MVKKSFSLILALILCLSAFAVAPLSASAQEEEYAYSGAAYDLAADGAEVRTVPTGDLKKSGDWVYAVEEIDMSTGAYIYAYNGTAKNLKIPAKIGGYKVFGVEFYSDQQKVNKNVTTITIPKAASYYISFKGEKFPNVSSFAVESGNENYYSKSGILYFKSGKEIVAYPPAKTAATFTVPEGSGYIVLSGARYLQNVVVPQSAYLVSLRNMPKLKKINLPAKVDMVHLSDCPALSTISVSAKSKKFTVNNGVLYEKWEKEYYMIFYPQTKTSASFSVPNNVTNVNIANNNYLKTLTLGKSTTVVRVSSAAKLTTVGVTTEKKLRSLAFFDCPALTGFKVNSGNKAYFVSGDVLYSKDKKTLLRYPNGKKGTSFTVPSCVTAIGDRAFEEAKQLKTIKLHANIAKIGQCAFAGCTAVTNMKLPNKVTEITYATFYGCKNLKNVNLPKKLKSIQHESFANCSSLFSVDVPKSVTTIEDGAIGCKTVSTPYYVTKPYKSFVVRGYKGTAAQTTAKTQKQKFVDITPTAVKLSAKTAAVAVKKTCALTATLTPANNADILKWTTSNAKVATVNGAGVVTGVKKGTATITVTTSNGKKASCKVTVK